MMIDENHWDTSLFLYGDNIDIDDDDSAIDDDIVDD